MTNNLAKSDTNFINLENQTNVTLHATILNEDWMYFYPGIVYLGDVEIKLLDQISFRNHNIIRAVVFEHENIGYYKKGTRVEIRGLLQKIQNPSREMIKLLNFSSDNVSEFMQIVVGTFENYGNEYIKNLEI